MNRPMWYIAIITAVNMTSFRKTIAIFFLFLPKTYIVGACMNSASLTLKFAKCTVSRENQRFAYAKTKVQISFVVTTKLISAFVFAS